MFKCCLLVLIIFSICSCATLNETYEHFKTKETFEEKTNTNVDAFIPESDSKTSIQKAETIEDALAYLKAKMVYKQIYLYEVISLTSRQDLLYRTCTPFESTKDVPNNINQFQDFINRLDLDNGKTFSFLRFSSSGYYILGYRCDKNHEEIESDFYDCTIGRDRSRCFAPALIRPEQTDFPKVAEAIKKETQKYICKEKNDTCDFFRDLSPSNLSSNKLTSKENAMVKELIDKLKKEKIKEKKQVEIEKRNERISEEKIKKEQEKHAHITIACQKGNANACWDLYVTNLDKDTDIANSFATRACQLGSPKACMIDERNRQEKFQQEQERMKKESNDREYQLAKESMEREELAKQERARENEREERAQIARDFSTAITMGIINDNKARERQIEKAKEESERQQELYRLKPLENTTRYTDCETDSDGSVHCRTR